MDSVYEITAIEKKDDLRESELMRIGKRFYIYVLAIGRSAVLPLQENENKSLITTEVIDINGSIGDDILSFTTKNSTYKLRKVGDDLSE